MTDPVTTINVTMPLLTAQQLAGAALEIMDKANIPASESAVIAAMQLRVMLAGIASGVNIVTQSETPAKPAE